MAIDYNVPMTWKEFKELSTDEQRNYLQYLMKEYGANCESFAQMFKMNAQTVRRYIKSENIGIQLAKGSRLNKARWNEFLGGILEQDEQSGGTAPEEPCSTSMRICSASMRFKGQIDVDVIANELKRVFDGKAEGEIEISYVLTSSGQ